MADSGCGGGCDGGSCDSGGWDSGGWDSGGWDLRSSDGRCFGKDDTESPETDGLRSGPGADFVGLVGFVGFALVRD